MTVYGWTLAGKPNRSSKYARDFDTVRTVPTYRILSYHQIFDLENYVVTFVFATYCGCLVTVVSELFLRYDCG